MAHPDLTRDSGLCYLGDMMGARSEESQPTASAELAEALRAGERVRVLALAAAAAVEARPNPGEAWDAARVRALRLALLLGEAAAEGELGAERADAAVLRAAGSIAAAARPRDLVAALASLARTLAALPSPPESRAARLARRAAGFIRQSFRRPLTLDEVAGHVRLSPAYFSALFKREQGVSFTRFLREVRLAEARRLLRETDRTVEEVANAVGFEDAHYFTRVFSREMGEPPGRFRERHRREAE